MRIYPKKNFKGLFSVPGDKSISHRAVMLASLIDGETEISGFLNGEDCISTINCLRQLGVRIDIQGEKVIVKSMGIKSFNPSNEVLYAGNSGTTIRILSGILAALPFETTITGDDSLQKRPMDRIIQPLKDMGAKIQSNNGFVPLKIKGGNLKHILYGSQTASAQVKSAILLAGLFAEGKTSVLEPAKSRDHTEIMLKYLGADIETDSRSVAITGGTALKSKPIRIAGDISSAAFLIVMALILKNSEITITNVGVNFTRTGIISALREMGANIDILNRRTLCGEFVADIKVRHSELNGITIGGDIIPRIIDEIPILAVAAVFAKGRTVIKDAQELKIKESNRIETLVTELKKMGANINATDDGMIINGGPIIKGGEVNSHNDHRIAMSLAVAALNAQDYTDIKDFDCVNISFPGFYDILNF